MARSVVETIAQAPRSCPRYDAWRPEEQQEQWRREIVEETLRGPIILRSNHGAPAVAVKPVRGGVESVVL